MRIDKLVMHADDVQAGSGAEFYGEVITDNIIRRSTAAEAVGETFYDKEIPEGRQVPIEEAEAGVLVTWRPNGENFAIIHEEVASELPA